jgi:hypothetical protein
VQRVFAEHISRDASGPELAARIRRRLDAREPASFVRLGDGEGGLLAVAVPGYPALTDYCVREVSRRHLGTETALVDAAPELLDGYRDAIVHADVVGFPDRDALGWLLSALNDRLIRSTFGVAMVLAYLEQLGQDGSLSRTAGSSFVFSLELLPHLPQLVHDRDVVLVTCHASLGPAVERELGARRARVLPVPIQAKLRPEQADTGHYPARYRELRHELSGAGAGVAPRSGQLVLVAAGVLGKVYCEAARAAGAVAVDIGSSADIWAGVRSRVVGQSADLLDRYRILM